jgi:hypothetical protein
MIVNEPFQLNQGALRAQLKGMEDLIASAPAHVLEEVRQRQQIDAHNAAVDKAKAKKKQFRQMAKQARIPVEVLKKMVKSVRKQG